MTLFASFSSICFHCWSCATDLWPSVYKMCVWWVCWPQSKRWWCAHKVPDDGGLCLPDPGVQRAALLHHRPYTTAPLYPYTVKAMFVYQSHVTILISTACINAPCSSDTLLVTVKLLHISIYVQKFSSAGALPPQLKKQALHIDLAHNCWAWKQEIWHEGLSEGYGELLKSLKLIGYEERQKKELVFHKYETKHDLVSVILPWAKQSSDHLNIFF